MSKQTRLFCELRAAAVASLIAPYALGAAQDIGFGDLLKGRSVPLAMKPADLPADYVAVQTTMASSGDMMSSIAAYLPLMMLGGAGAAAAEQMGLYRAIGTSWTDGTIVNIGGQKYLVTYKLDFDMSALAAMRPNQGESAVPHDPTLKLTLLRSDGIQTFTPDPAYTKAQFIAALTGSTAKDMPGTAIPMLGQTDAKTEAMTNAKQVALGVMMYCADYDDQFPYVQSTKTLQAVTYPYMKSLNLWKDPNPNGGRLLFNMKLAGVNASDIPSPAETPMLYEEKPWPDGTRVVAFADGHTKRIQKDGWPSIASALSRTYKRHGKPLPVDYDPNPK